MKLSEILPLKNKEQQIIIITNNNIGKLNVDNQQCLKNDRLK